MSESEAMPEVTEKRLLILDDDPLIGQTIRHIAEFSRFEVEAATTPEDFFALVDAWKPDFIALDLVMPGMDGVEVMAELARRNCRSRLIITSGVGNRVLDAAGRSAAEHGLNVAGLLPKPFTPSSLRKLLTRSAGPEPRVTASVEADASGQGSKAGRHRIVAADLRRALEEGELEVVYQPKLACQSGVLAGFEALARWRHAAYGEIEPKVFIPLAEISGLIDELTLGILEQALNWFGGFCRRAGNAALAQDLSKLTLSMNISARSLGNQQLFDRIDALSRELGIDPQRVIFELTETSAMEDPVTSLDLLTRLRMKGFHLSIDDFGTGFSSMLQLVRLPFSEMKVDRSFVSTARGSAESRAVIQSIIELGRSLCLTVTAEGIEDEETLVYLRNIGCDQAQGFFIARPMNGAEVERWLQQREPDNEQRRLTALHNLNLLDTPEEERFDSLTGLAQRLFDMPMAALGLVDSERLCFKSRVGIIESQLPRHASFCTHTIESDEVFVIEDTHQDMRFSGNPYVTGKPHIRFYAGRAIHAADGSRIGTLCLMDRQPRRFSRREAETLCDLAQLLEKELYGEQQTVRDGETGALSQSGFDARSEIIMSLCGRLALPFTLMLVEMENIEPPGQDEEIAKKNAYRTRTFCRMLTDSLRDTDLVGRLGRDKFIVLLTAAGQDQLEEAKSQLHHRVTDYNRGAPRGLEVRYELGTAVSAPGHPENLQSLLARAEMNMY